MSIDLEALRRSAPDESRPSRGAGRRLLWVASLLALAAGAFWLLRPFLFPPRHVMTSAVRVETGAARASTAAEAAGWIEAEPYATVVRPLVDAVVQSIDVLEGSPVKANETVVGRLASAPLRAALERAEKTLAHHEHHVAEAQADADRAKALYDQRLDLRREVARLEAEEKSATAGVSTSRAALAQAEQALEVARIELASQERLEASGAGTPIVRAKATAAEKSAEAEVEAKKAEVERALANATAATKLLALAQEGLDHPEALAGEMRSTAAHLESAAADADSAKTERDIAAREVGWLTVVSPVDGVVLRREAAPGSNVGPSAMPRGGAESSSRMADSGEGGLVTIYDPKRLQARVDVPLSSVGGVGAGRKAELTVEAAPGRTFHGVVTRVQSQADPLKNTLQVKVRIDDPDPVLKPEMLVRARFLAEANAPGGAAPSPGSTARILVPKAAVRGGAVFVVDPRGGGRARRVPVEKVGDEGDWVEVKGDVSATQRVILDEVEDGERVHGGES